MKKYFTIKSVAVFFLLLSIASAITYMIPISLIVKYDLDQSVISFAPIVFMFSIGFACIHMFFYALAKFSRSKLNSFRMSFIPPAAFLILIELIGPAKIFYIFDLRYIDTRGLLPAPDFEADINAARLIQLSRILLDTLIQQTTAALLMLPVLFIYYYLIGGVFNVFRRELVKFKN